MFKIALQTETEPDSYSHYEFSVFLQNLTREGCEVE